MHSPISLRLAVASTTSLAALLLSAGTAMAQTAASFETPEYFASHALAQVNAAEAYALGFTGKGVLIGIADTGLDSRHSEFLGRVLPGYNFLTNRTLEPGTNSDVTPHGTHVTGIAAAARDGKGMHGVAFEAQIVPAKLGAFGGLDLYASTPWPFLASQGVSVINASYRIGGEPSPLAPDVTNVTRNEVVTQFPKVLEGARGLAEAGILMVVANGNAALPNPDPLPALPHLFPELKDNWLAVGAVDANNVIADFSNRCGVARDWCLVAPGVGIYSTLPSLRSSPTQMRYGLDEGTSMAAPVVTGAAAVLKQAFPWFSAYELQQTLLTTATDLGAPGVDDIYGWGLLNLGKAVRGPAQFVADFETDTKGWSGTFSNDISGVGGLIKTGLGTLELTGHNTYAGGTAVYGGTLAISSDVNLGAAGTGLAIGGGTLEVLADGFTTARPLTLSGPGTLQIDLGTATFAGPIADGSRPGVLVKTGPGSVVLSAANTVTGGASIEAGTLELTAEGSLVSPVTVHQGASFVNAGAIAGGATNAGTLSTSGTINGGLTNAGTVLASAGRIDGAIANNAGLLAVSGPVASNGTLANAAGATLAVTGSYSLAGPLTNAGLVTVARTASLTAAAGLSNAGLVASEGTLTTDLTNTGIARLSGQFNGTLTNAGLLQITGPLAGLTTLTNTGALDLGGGALTVASLEGSASAVLGNGALTVTGAASSAYAGAILESTSPTSLIKAGTGTLSLNGTGRFSGPTTIQAGTLSLNGVWTSPVTVAAPGTLRGIGTIAAPVTVAGALRPGNSPGTLTVLGPVAFAPGSSFGLDIDGPGTGTGAGSYARLLALGTTGTVAANGTLVPVLRGITGNATNSFTPALGQRFGVLAAQAGLSGSFTGLAQPTAGLPAGTRFDALYAATSLDLVVTPAAYGNLAGLGLSQSGNAQAVGAALDNARPAAGTRPDAMRARVFDPLYAADPATLAGGLASLSGQSYGDAVMTDLAARRLIADTIDRHQRGLGGGATAFSAGDLGLGPNRATLQVRGGAGAADQPLAVGEGRVWADALYGFGTRAGDRAASGAGFDAGGLLLGLDRQVGADTQVGGAFSYLREDGTSRGAGLGRFASDSYGGTLYASTRLGAVVLRGTAGVSYADGRIDRTVALGSAVSPTSGLASGWSGGVAGFAGYVLAAGLPVEVVPEVGFSYDRLTRGRVAERGGLASQGFALADLDAARSLVGGRVTSVAFAGVADLRLEGRAYWAHELADTYAVVRSGLFGAAFASRTSALGRDGAVLGVSLTGAVAEGVQLRLGYTGDLRSGATAQVFSAGLQAAW
ncbi:S8 family serine peptidase [Methylobacterium organophilum]|uniref:Autotransporter domain-containing protein n=1 Tax=Methylobacterium organophilum TaxID=410 RepID=A0ABQ4T9D4_METOR|nr:S8 family serine peptidase [Methylobacterium organophilum]GJE27928.1 hypothetical protein LKMONMHP_2790 [Methylobacterium organophilum]